MNSLSFVVEPDGLARLRLSRPERHNAFDEHLVASLHDALDALARDAHVRALLIEAQGQSFCAGADLEWMRRMSACGFEENLRDAQALAAMLRRLDEFPCPTVALVQGAAYGGGVGIIAACDIALASAKAHFALTEVKLGLAPAVISPYVVAAIGARAARRYMLSAERFDAQQAQTLGLVHLVTEPAELEARAMQLVGSLLEGAPQAQQVTKQLVRAIAAADATALVPASAHAAPAARDALDLATATLIATLRASAEGREGVGAFLERRAPAWRAARERA